MTIIVNLFIKKFIRLFLMKYINGVQILKELFLVEEMWSVEVVGV